MTKARWTKASDQRGAVRRWSRYSSHFKTQYFFIENIDIVFLFVSVFFHVDFYNVQIGVKNNICVPVYGTNE